MLRLPLGSVGICSFQDLPRRPRCATDKYVYRNKVSETETRQFSQLHNLEGKKKTGKELKIRRHYYLETQACFLESCWMRSATRHRRVQSQAFETPCAFSLCHRARSLCASVSPCETYTQSLARPALRAPSRIRNFLPKPVVLLRSLPAPA